VPGSCGGSYHVDRHPGFRQTRLHFHGVTEDVSAMVAERNRPAGQRV
jgi:hypothetical protein